MNIPDDDDLGLDGLDFSGATGGAVAAPPRHQAQLPIQQGMQQLPTDTSPVLQNQNQMQQHMQQQFVHQQMQQLVQHGMPEMQAMHTAAAAQGMQVFPIAQCQLVPLQPMQHMQMGAQYMQDMQMGGFGPTTFGDDHRPGPYARAPGSPTGQFPIMINDNAVRR